MGCHRDAMKRGWGLFFICSEQYLHAYHYDWFDSFFEPEMQVIRQLVYNRCRIHGLEAAPLGSMPSWEIGE